MDNVTNRSLINQLADDIGWLEQHCQKKSEHAARINELHLAAALIRNCVGPFLDGQATAPLHIAVVGGAGAGKSTVSNMLSGAPAAEANPQAGFTRHPIAYTQGNGAVAWAGHLGFLGKLQRLTQQSPSSLDADVYQVRLVPSNPAVQSILHKYVVWDCPDMTTWAATGYVPRLLEIAGLADIVVYVASDERYNDEVPTQFLDMLLQAGKPVVCCLTKMREAQAAAFVAHFQKEVLEKMSGGAVCLAIPNLPHAQLSDPARLAGKYRIPLINQVMVLGEPADAARKRNVRWAVNYLCSIQEKMLNVARQDVQALDAWRGVVQSGQAELEDRYYREFLITEKFQRFDEALIRLIDMLEFPGVGRQLSNVLWVVRTPYRLLKGFLGKSLSRPEAPPMPELPVLEAALASWIDMLRKESAQRAASHPLWAHIEKGFSSGLSEKARERFQQGFRAYQLGMADEVERTARSIHDELEKNPVVLNTLRGSKFALDAVAITGAIVAGGITAWDLVWVPLAAALTQQLVELLGSKYVESQREATRNRQRSLLTHYVSAPLAEWLTQWPATGGSSYERLQLALRRIPQAVQQLDAAVNKALTGAVKA